MLVYTSPALTEDVLVCGPITGWLYASLSARDTDFMMKLLDVWPNDYAQRLTDGMVRARFRESMERPTLIEPERVYKYSMSLWYTCQMFKQGHSIRVEVASTAFPKYDRNPNTGETLGTSTRLETAQQKIYHDRERASFISLPIIPRRP